MSGVGDGAAAGARRVKALLLFAFLAAPVQAQPRPCLTTPEAEALATAALPYVLRQTGVRCAAKLAADSPLRREDSELLRRYDRAADAAWPAAKAAIVKLSDAAASLLLASDYARPLLGSLVAPMIAARLPVEDCATVDRLVTLLAPLPPRNVAGLAVVAADRARRVRPAAGASNPVAALPLCAVETR